MCLSSIQDSEIPLLKKEGLFPKKTLTKSIPKSIKRVQEVQQIIFFVLFPEWK